MELITTAACWARHLLEAAGVTDDEPGVALVTKLFASEEEGRSCLRLRVDESADLSGKDDDEETARRLVACGMATNVENHDESFPLVFADGAEPLLYLQRYYRAERRILAFAALNKGQEGETDRKLTDLLRSHRLVVLAGGPGSGKTTAIAHLLRSFPVSERPNIKLLAPTARAALRLGDALDQAGVDGDSCEPQTLHRALGAGHGRFRFNRERRLEARLVILDEASMLDLQLCAALMEALPEEARLLLVGDPDQLPAVGVGSLLSDLLAAGVPCHRLRESRRFPAESPVGALATCIREGVWDERLWNAGSEENYVRWMPLRHTDDLQAGLQGWLREHGEFLVARPGDTAAELLARFDRQRILCAHNSGVYGVDAVGLSVRHWLRRQGLLGNDGMGEPWMVRHNDYALQLFNGDVGFRMADGFCFPDRGDRRYMHIPAAQRSLATTIHKSQGSEFSHVLVVLPPEQSALLTRELLYTAITRVRPDPAHGGGGVTVLAGEKALRGALAATAVRPTGLVALHGNIT